MFVIAGLVLGALGGAWQARRRGGRAADIAQYAAAYAILFGLIGLFVTLVIDRMMRG